MMQETPTDTDPAGLPTRISRYSIRALLGRGALGAVYLAHQADLDREVALRVMTPGPDLPESLIERFLDDARAAASLTGPGIVPIFDVGREGDARFIAMERVEGIPLPPGPLDPTEALRIALRIAETLQEAHDRNFLHRNLKPTSLFLDSKRRPRIGEWGMSVSLEESDRLAIRGAAYGSPEQAFGSPEEIDGRTDVYSLGVVLYEMLTGRRPFEGQDVFAVLKQVQLADPVPPSSRRPGLAAGLDRLVLKALEKDPSARYATAEEFARALRAALREIAEGRHGPEREPRHRKPALFGIVAVALAALLGWLARAPEPPVKGEPKVPGAVVEGPDPAVSRADRLHAFFVRRCVIEWKARIPYLRERVDLDLEREIAELKSPEEVALAEAIRFTIAGKFREALERSRAAGVRGAVVARNAAFHLSPGRGTEPAADATLAELFLHALDAAAAGDGKEARRRADLLLRAPRPTVDALLCRALVMERLGRPELAREALQVAQALDPLDPFALHFDLALAVVGRGDLGVNPTEATGVLLEASVPSLRDRSASPAPHVFLGIVNLVQGNWKLAEESFATARERSAAVDPRPQDGGALIAAAGTSTAEFLLEGGRFLLASRLAGAEGALDEALGLASKAEVDGQEPFRRIRREAHVLLAEAVLARDPQGAVSHLRAALEEGLDREALRKDPRFGAVQQALGEADGPKR